MTTQNEKIQNLLKVFLFLFMNCFSSHRFIEDMRAFWVATADFIFEIGKTVLCVGRFFKISYWSAIIVGWVYAASARCEGGIPSVGSSSEIEAHKSSSKSWNESRIWLAESDCGSERVGRSKTKFIEDDIYIYIYISSQSHINCQTESHPRHFRTFPSFPV